MSDTSASRTITRRAFLGDCTAGVAALAVGGGAVACASERPDGPDSTDGEATGPRVAWVRDSSATSWDFSPASGYYDFIDQATVNAMLDAAVVALTRQPDPASAWRQVMATYVAGDIVAVKINTNDTNWGESLINAVGEVNNAIVRGLLSAGVPEDRIHVYDAMRPGGGHMPARIAERTLARYPRVGFLDHDTATWGTGFVHESVAYAGNADFICNHLCAAQHLISVPLLKAITPFWGVSGALKLHLGTIRDPGVTHGSLHYTNPTLNPAAVINANPHVRDKLRLVVADGLFGMDSGIHFPGDDPAENHVDVPRRWWTFGDGAANSLLVAFDPVAIDSVMHDIIARERVARGLAPMAEPVLQAAAAAQLGVHESAADMRYRQIQLDQIEA